MNNEKQQVLNELRIAYNSIVKANSKLQNINIHEQFDYCTSSELSNLTDKIEMAFKLTEKIVYQGV